MDPLFELNGKLILVSGGSRGIGKALVSGFAKRGARVVFTGRDEDSLESAKKELAEDSSEVFPECCDVSRVDEVEALVNRVRKQHGPIDVLVNVAGVNRRQRAETYLPEDYDFVMDINLKGAFFLSTEVGRVMLENGSGIQINIDSLNSYVPVKGKQIRDGRHDPGVGCRMGSERDQGQFHCSGIHSHRPHPKGLVRSFPAAMGNREHSFEKAW